ncbi:MAG: hypothetical protein JWO88_2318 [Frankiales bacterium]|nr:hypothetical protein [Frankiales bacterium]
MSEAPAIPAQPTQSARDVEAWTFIRQMAADQRGVEQASTRVLDRVGQLNKSELEAGLLNAVALENGDPLKFRIIGMLDAALASELFSN